MEVFNTVNLYSLSVEQFRSSQSEKLEYAYPLQFPILEIVSFLTTALFSINLADLKASLAVS